MGQMQTEGQSSAVGKQKSKVFESPNKPFDSVKNEQITAAVNSVVGDKEANKNRSTSAGSVRLPEVLGEE